ncbi:DUF3134 domain-containing protein [Moorena sp. SIO3B2]|uniref:DUF3134 domain-containing protein n=1 Tax=Moorena sp. SIO3B2 TaxID=2607827 RepID=UPI0013CAB1EF|nr:DUF3134 domain-containing protein [Moorena sp. SIO3B2]NEP34399.1 DUF3134 domain-containing protein [Moorena sp. SIO3B2]
MYNPALREIHRDQLAEVIPLKQETSLLDWLESNNRLIPRENLEEENPLGDDVEISELMGVEDSNYEDEEENLG